MSQGMEIEATSTIPQSQPLPGQVPNEARGFSWKVDDMQRLRRFLCLGSEGGTYYIGEKTLGRENAESILRLIATGRGQEVVKEIVTFSVEGRAANQNPIIFALALCARGDDVDTKSAAYESLSKVCRIPTHLFAFVQFCEALSVSTGTGWGRAHRRAIQNWYTEKPPKSLAMAVTKYRQREGWSHIDLLRLSHVKCEKPSTSCILRYIVKGLDSCKTDYAGLGQEVDNILAFLEAVETAKDVKKEADIVHLIKKFQLVREHVPTEHLNSKVVWSVLLQDMPMTALIRNLGKMSAIGLLEPLSGPSKYACERLQDESLLKAARIHPFSILLALETYRSGKGDKGKLSWDVNQSILAALNAAFYLSFKFVEPTGKRFLLALDVSGSMCWNIIGSSFTARMASIAMAMVTARTEKQNMILGFSHKLVPINIGAHTSLENAMATVNSTPMGWTDCALPMLHAIKMEYSVDVFIVYTDNETWFGSVHPSEALKRYRKFSNINAKLVVCGMASNEFSIADPDDPGMLDIVGFDSAAPEVIRNFVLGLF